VGATAYTKGGRGQKMVLQFNTEWGTFEKENHENEGPRKSNDGSREKLQRIVRGIKLVAGRARPKDNKEPFTPWETQTMGEELDKLQQPKSLANELRGKKRSNRSKG